MSRQSEVKAFFEQPEIYLHFDYNLRIRMETVAGFIGDKQFENVLDMPCGSGDISLPLTDQFEQLTLVDFASHMVDIAIEKAEKIDPTKLRFINGDFFKLTFEKESYDLVIALGILAHVDSPSEFLKRLMPLIKPGGHLVLQNVDSAHWYSGLIRTYLGVRKLFGKDKYKLNKVPEKDILPILKEGGFELQNQYRYNQSFLGFSRLFSNDKKYKLTRNFFGNHERNKHAGWGCDHIYHFVKK